MSDTFYSFGVADVECTAIDREWDGDRPNILMHPPCACPACAPPEFEADEASWLIASGTEHRHRVETAELGATGIAVLG